MISFIIPTLNEEKTLGKLLHCLNRYHGEFEIIISDGRSTDTTLSLARKAGAQTVVYNGMGKQTIGAGKNAGAKEARGNFLVFLDADTYIEDPNAFFSRALSQFQLYPRLVALTGKLKVFKEVQTWADYLVFGCMNSLNYVLNNVVRLPGAPGEFQMIKAGVFHKIGGYDERLPLSEDYEIFRRLKKFGTTRFDNKLVVFHTGRRAHTLGWPYVLWEWFKNFMSVLLFKKPASAQWGGEVR